MKSKIIIVALGLLALLSTRVEAQVSEESRIKILPTSQEGVVKVLYAIETDERLEVRFLDRSGEVTKDVIKGGPYPNGVSKRYDVRNINKNDFWIEVTSPQLSVTYHLIPSKDRKTFVSYLEKATYNHALVASNN
jgi:hypothetical protein